MSAATVTTLAYQEKMASPTPEEAMMVRKAQVLIDYAIDRWIGVLAGEGKAEATRRKYRQVLDPFGDLYRHKSPGETLQPNPHGDRDAAVADAATVADRLLEEAHNKAKPGEPAGRVETDQDLAPGEPKKGSVT